MKKVQYDLLRARLFSKFVNYKPLRSINSLPTAIFELQSFDEKQIDTFLMKFDQKYIEVCKRDWSTVKAFLMKIYDLSDLMRRPILLNMINETILETGDDIFSNAQTLGPSSLYDIYTRTQLALDWHKGEVRQFLTSEQRRTFAESIALSMFDRKKLEVSYDEIIAVISKHDSVLGKLRNRLESVSAEEVASDIQICAFLTRDQGGLFRFSHKSFMEYFVAVYLKSALQSKRVDTRFQGFLPKEILYFLGGFAFVEPSVKQLLIDWFKNKKLSSESPEFRRNIAGAVLYSGPEHKNLRLEDVTIFDIDILKTNMLKARFKDISFNRVRQEKVGSDSSVYENVEYAQSHLIDWNLSNCEVSVNFVDTEARRIDAVNSKFIICGRRGLIERSRFESCEVEATGVVKFEQCTFGGGTLELPAVKGETSLEFHVCRFTGVKITSSFEFTRHSIRVSGCSFENCSVFGLRLQGQDLGESLAGCKGVVLIGEPLSKFRNKFNASRENILIQGNLLLILASAWMTQVNREKVIAEIEETFGESFENEIRGLRESLLMRPYDEH